MCGIAGLIYRGKQGPIGQEMTAMLQSLRHRGPDSTGFALYGQADDDPKTYVMRFKVAEQEDCRKGFDIHHQIRERRGRVDDRLQEMGAEVLKRDEATEYAFRYLLPIRRASSGGWSTTSRISRAPRSSRSARRSS